MGGVVRGAAEVDEATEALLHQPGLLGLREKLADRGFKVTILLDNVHYIGLLFELCAPQQKSSLVSRHAGNSILLWNEAAERVT